MDGKEGHISEMKKTELLQQFISELEHQGIPHTVASSVFEIKKLIVDYLWRKKIREVITSPGDLLKKFELYPYLLPFSGDLENVRAGITLASYGVAWSGGIVELYNSNAEKYASLVPEIHIAIIKSSNILQDFTELFEKIPADRDATLITGPSKTADIEKIVVKGAHGPRELQVIIFEE